MVDLFTTRLDGISDLHAVSSRTVFARWNERVGENPTPDLERMLAVARASDARYALVGSAVGVGPTLRLTAELYQTADGRENLVDVESAQMVRDRPPHFEEIQNRELSPSPQDPSCFRKPRFQVRPIANSKTAERGVETVV